METPDAARRRVYPPLPPAWPPPGLHQGPLLRLPEPALSQSTPTPQGAAGHVLLPRHGTAQPHDPPPCPATSHDPPGTTVPHLSWATRPPPSSLTPPQSSPMSPLNPTRPAARQSQHRGLASRGTALQAQGCLHCPQPSMGGASACPPTLYSPLKPPHAAPLRQLSSPLPPSSTTLPDSSAPPPTH